VAKDSNVGDSNRFGYSVSIKDGLIIIGASYDDELALNAGAAYIFLWYGTEWMEQEKLIASDGLQDEEFGFSVAIDGDYAIVGSPRNGAMGTNSGAAYIFHWNRKYWEEQQKLTPSSQDEQHGYSVSMSGDYALVGAPYDNGGRGSAYLYRRNGSSWQEIVNLTASDQSPNDNFGWSVSIDGDYAIIGAPLDDDRGADSGSAYLFHWNGSNWVQQQKITSSDGEPNDDFGQSVSIRGDRAVVGAQKDDDNGPDSGSGYIFELNGTVWEENDKITAPDGEFDDLFGCSVSVSTNSIIVGAEGDNDNGVDAGSLYYF
jgi:hypothetical protein